MAVPPLVAAKAAQSAAGGLQKALTGDIYTKTWTEVVGRGKKAKVVEKTVHVNPVGIGLGALAIGAAATAGVAALWLAQLKLTPTVHQQYRTVVDVPGYTVATGGIPPFYDVPAVTHREYTGKAVKRFAIDQRQPFTISDMLPAPVREFKESAEGVAKSSSIVLDLALHPWKAFKK